ncbi:hypothetical protein MKX01_003690 [Papaver californicum]|nr:hypothetical protein MKX01_003690 [Papaver californicum]
MMLCCSSLRSRIQSWFHDYDNLQSLLSFSFTFKYSFTLFISQIRISCALIGSLGALFNGVTLVNFVIELLSLIAIESSSQRLGRTYAILLCCGILLNISWFILFPNHTWNISSKMYGLYFIFSLRLALWMQIAAFSIRLFSSLLWFQMYRLGPSSTDFDVRNSFMNPSVSAIGRQSSISSTISGFPLSDTAYYSVLFEDAQENGGMKNTGGNNASSVC